MRADDEKAHGLGVVLRQHVADGEEVAQALGHLFVVHPHKTVVHPEERQRFAVSAFALGDFVLMVGKLQVSAAAVNVKALAQGLAAHGRALDVPAGPALAIGAVPLGVCGLALFGGFPEHKVQRVLLAIEHGHALAGTQLIE